MTRKKWSQLRDRHLQTPEARALYDEARADLEAKLAAYWKVLAAAQSEGQEPSPEQQERAAREMWEALEQAQGAEPDFEELGRRIWAEVYEPRRQPGDGNG